MSELAINLDEYVDPETGEILEQSQSIVTEDLPKLARSLRTLRLRMDMIDKFGRDELARITVRCCHKTEALRGSYDYLLGVAKTLMPDKERLEYPGLGVLKFGTTRESVDDDEYTEFTIQDQEALHYAWPHFFRTKTTISPDKKKIMAALKRDETVSGFKINPKHETFSFKAEA